MSRTRRLKIIEEIEKKRQSKVLVYVTGDRPGVPPAHIAPDVLPIFEQHIQSLIQEGTEKLDLFLYSRGGHSDTPWSIVTLLREYLDDLQFGVLIPFRAHSAATVIAIGADEIVMTPIAELGPIDATIQGGHHSPRDPNSHEPLPMSVEEVRGYMELLGTFDIDTQNQRMKAFSDLTANVHPLGLGAVNRLLSQTERVAEELLRMRHSPLSDEKVRRIVDALASEIGSHNHSIRRSEAKKIGIDFVTKAEDEGVQDELLKLHGEYVDLLQLNCPFDGQGDLIAHDLEEQTWEDQKLAVIESSSGKNLLTTNLRIMRNRQVPPQVSIDLSNLQLQVPAMPPEFGDQIQTYLRDLVMPSIQAQIEEVTKQAADRLAKSLPQTGFQIFMNRTSWNSQDDDA